jgi:hypothetical protein
MPVHGDTIQSDPARVSSIPEKGTEWRKSAEKRKWRFSKMKQSGHAPQGRNSQAADPSGLAQARPTWYGERAVPSSSELAMNDSAVSLSETALPPEVAEFAVEKGVSRYLSAVIELARQAFPSSELRVSLGQDAEDDGHQYIALDVDVASRATEELLTGPRIWSAGLSRACPSRYAVYFVLGWQ